MISRKTALARIHDLSDEKRFTFDDNQRIELLRSIYDIVSTEIEHINKGCLNKRI